MNTNLINHIVRNNISKPTMFSRTTHAVMNMGKPIQPPLASIVEESDIKLEKQAPIRYYKTLEKQRILDDAAARAELAKKMKEVTQSKLANNATRDDKQEIAEIETKKNPIRPAVSPSSKLLQAVMSLSDKSVSNLKYLSRKGIETNFQQNKPKHLRPNGSILSGSSSRYHRRNKHRLHSHMFHNTIHTYTTQSYITDRPRNQQMNSTWASKSSDMTKSSIHKALMPVDKGVRNLISVSNGNPFKETDPMYNWNHPPSPDDYEINLERIIDTVPQTREVQRGRLRLLQKHSSWENHVKATKNMDAAETFAKYGRSGKSFLPTDDPNCILDKPRKKDLTIPNPPKTQEEIEAHLRKCNSIDAMRNAKRYGPPPNSLPNVTTVPWPPAHKRNELLRSPKWEPGSRYLHTYGMDPKEVD